MIEWLAVAVLNPFAWLTGGGMGEIDIGNDDSAYARNLILGSEDWIMNVVNVGIKVVGGWCWLWWFKYV